jgi:hypothetical protein
MGEVEDRPWERQGCVRRDCDPHRGHLLVLLAEISCWCGLLSFCLVFPSVLGVLTGVAAWVMASRDLGRMRLGQMDVRGRLPTQHAKSCAAYGVVFNVLGTSLVGCLIAAIVRR